jgi:hypothetical protein
MAEVTLELIGRQLERVITKLGDARDDMAILLARMDRLDIASHATADEMRSAVDELRVMNSRHDRPARRVDRLEERLDTIDR